MTHIRDSRLPMTAETFGGFVAFVEFADGGYGYWFRTGVPAGRSK